MRDNPACERRKQTDAHSRKGRRRRDRANCERALHSKACPQKRMGNARERRGAMPILRAKQQRGVCRMAWEESFRGRSILEGRGQLASGFLPGSLGIRGERPAEKARVTF